MTDFLPFHDVVVSDSASGGGRNGDGSRNEDHFTDSDDSSLSPSIEPFVVRGAGNVTV